MGRLVVSCPRAPCGTPCGVPETDQRTTTGVCIVVFVFVLLWLVCVTNTSDNNTCISVISVEDE